MNFVNIIEELERLIVSLFFWIVFIPKTLYKIISHPTWVPGYIDEEFKRDSKKFDDFISPIILFFISTVCMLLLLEYLAKAVNFDVDMLPFVQLFSNNNNDIIDILSSYKVLLIGLIFLSIPFQFALIIELFRVKRLTRDGLRRVFYIQCFYFSPLALYFMIGFISLWLIGTGDYMEDMANFLFIGIFLWFGIVQTRFISKELKRGWIWSVFILILLVILVMLTIYMLLIKENQISEFLTAPFVGYTLLVLLTSMFVLGVINLAKKELSK